jgi:hypothetical protein
VTNRSCARKTTIHLLAGDLQLPFLEKSIMQTTKEQKLRKRPKVLVLAILVALVIFLQAPGARSFFHETREHLWQWSVEKAVSAAARELQKRARF